MPKIKKDLLKVKGSDGQWHYVPAVGGSVDTTPTWNAILNKPFESLGDGLSVENGVLSAKGGTGGSPNAVQYVAQELTDEQKTQARKNIDADKKRIIYNATRGNYGRVNLFDSASAQNAAIDKIIAEYKAGTEVVMRLQDRDFALNQIEENAGKIWFSSYSVTADAKMNVVTFMLEKDTTAVEESYINGIKAVNIDSTLQITNYAADAKAVGDALQNYVSAEEFGKLLNGVGDALDTKLDKNQGATNAGKILGVGEDGNVVPQDKPTYTLPQATADALGGIKADAATAEDTQPVRIGADGKMKTKPYTLTDADKTAVAEEVVADGVAATLVDIPSGGGGTWEKLIDTTIEAGEGITAISLNLPKSDIAKGYACQLEFTKSTGDAWGGNANMTPRINGALMGYFLFNDDLSKNSINYFAIGNFELLGNGYIDFVRHVYSLENNPSNVARQLGANKFTANVTGKFEMGFAGKTYIGTAKIKVWGRYK